MTLHRIAASNGLVELMMALGNFYLLGIEVEKDVSNSFRWYCEAAHRGNYFDEVLWNYWFSAVEGACELMKT